MQYSFFFKRFKPCELTFYHWLVDVYRKWLSLYKPHNSLLCFSHFGHWKGVVLSFNCIFELVLLSACDFGCVSLWKPRISHATNLRSQSHLKQRWNRELQKYFCTTVAPIVIFSLLTPLLLSKSASEASVGCGGHLSLFFHKNSAPFLHFSNFLVSEALIPREA